MNNVQLPQAYLGKIEHQLDQLGHQQTVLQSTVHHVSTAQDHARSELNDLRAQFTEYLRRDELGRNLQLAQTQIVAVCQQLDTEYGHYKDVRRHATGTLQAMDVGVVTHDTLQGVSEELMLATPRYWLAPALVALASWIRDDRTLADRALAEALKRDNDKTSLFLALVLRRHERSATVARWLGQYLARQDPRQLPKEFTVVLDAMVTGALGPAAKPLVLEATGEWFQYLVADPAAVDAQVARWRDLINGLQRPIGGAFTVLPAISPTWPLLESLYAGATVHGQAEVLFRGRLEGTLQPDPDLRSRVDGILDSLVGNYDAEEAPLRRKEAELQAVVDHGGDKEAAARASAAEAAVHDTTTDYLTLLSNAAFYPDKVGATAGSQRLAISLMRDWIVQAAGQLEAANVQAFPRSVELQLEGWSGEIDGSATEDTLVASVAQHVQAETDAQVAAVRFTGGALAAAVGAAVAVVIGLLSLAGAVGFGVFCLLLAAASGGYAAYAYRALPARRAAIRQAGERRKTAAVAQVRGAVAEAVDWRRAWEAELGKAAVFREYLNSLNRDAFIASMSREVMT